MQQAAPAVAAATPSSLPPLPPKPAAVIRTAEAVPAVRRVKRKRAQEVQMPNKGLHCIPESAMFQQLQETEASVDRTLKLRRLAWADALSLAPREAALKLRLYVYNTFANQPPPSSDAPPVLASGAVPPGTDPPSWTLQLYGQLFDPVTEPGGPPLPSPDTPARKPLTSLLRRLEIQLDPQLYPAPGNRIVWEHQAQTGPPRESLEFGRIGNVPNTVILKLDVEHEPPRHELPEALALALGLQHTTVPRVTAALWQYIKARNLQSRTDPVMADPDSVLASVFGPGPLDMTTLETRLHRMLPPMRPITMTYNVRLDGQNPTHPECLDLDVFIALQDVKPYALVEKLSKDKEIEAHNTKITSIIHRIDEHRRRRDFLLSFAHSPVDFANAVIASQARDLRVARSVPTREFEVERRSDVFAGDWIHEAVMKHLHRRMAAGH